jgi:hypothetical protein
MSVSKIESAYRQRMDALTPAERVARSAALFQWTREQIARNIQAERGDVDHETLKWLVALRLYSGEEMVCKWIKRKLADVSD